MALTAKYTPISENRRNCVALCILQIVILLILDSIIKKKIVLHRWNSYKTRNPKMMMTIIIIHYCLCVFSFVSRKRKEIGKNQKKKFKFDDFLIWKHEEWMNENLPPVIKQTKMLQAKFLLKEKQKWWPVVPFSWHLKLHSRKVKLLYNNDDGYCFTVVVIIIPVVTIITHWF